MAFDRLAFLAARKLPVEIVSTVTGDVHVHSLTAGEKDEYDLAVQQDPGKRFRARLVQMTARDADGRHLFTPEDLDALAELPVAAIEPLFEAAIRVNRMSDADAEALRKN